MILTVLYPSRPEARFDYDYYLARHTPLVREVWSPDEVTVYRGVVGVGGAEAPFRLVAHIRFASAEALEAALAGERAGEVFADVAAFTDIEPVALITSELT
jgi:uncharacterized protein (TIGR02118 family)